MISKHVDITIPILLGEEHFVKNEWGEINYLVGANGMGKSLLAEQIKDNFNGGGLQSRYLSVGLEKQREARHGGGNLQPGFNLT